jgi:chromosome segregation protein
MTQRKPEMWMQQETADCGIGDWKLATPPAEGPPLAACRSLLYTTCIMYLKRLELRGFKTFAPYTDFLFDAGITAIVGPNGSGKSNIADAVRWVLGEQSYSALRGKCTEDMIFAGTSRRPQLGMAEAVMTFDNTSQWLPLDFGEVTVSRRAYRSGENKYFINASRVRMRDVVELLGRAGLGRRGFVVIGQGLVDAALSLNAVERRTLFEEAAGIHIYQAKRKDALNKLAETRQNILRVNDILNEIAPRMRQLERQAKRAEEYDLLGRDLEKLLRIWYGYQWQRRDASLNEAEALLKRREGDLDLGRARMHEVEALIASTQARQGDMRLQLSAWHKASGDLHAEAEVAGRELAVSRERLNLFQQHQRELQTELAQLHVRRSALEETVGAVQAERQRLGDEAQALAAQLPELRAQWQRSETARAGLEEALEAARDKAFHLATAMADARNRCKQLQERRAQAAAEREQQQHELTAVEDQLSALEGDVTQARRQEEDVLRSQEAAAARQSQLQEQLVALEEELRQRRETLAKASRERQRMQDRREMLQGLRQGMAGFASGTKAVLRSRERLAGIVGPVVSLLRVPQNLERAVEAALGEYAQALVVSRWKDASAAIDQLRTQSAGWATFLPLDSLTAPRAERVPAGKGVVGLAQHLVECDARYESVLQLLLGQVVIVEDLATARRVRPDLQPGQRLVTLAGEVVQASGVISGGSGRGEGSLLAQEREWRELPGQLAALQRHERAAETALGEVERSLQACQQERTDSAGAVSRLTEQREAVGRRLTALQQKQAHLQQEIEWRRRLNGQQQRELLALDAKGSTLQREVDERTQEHSGWKVSLDESLASLEAARQDEEAARQRMAEGETALAVAQRQVKAQDQLLSSQEANLARLDQEIAAKSGRENELQRESEALGARVHALQVDADALSASIAELATQIDPAETEVLTLERQVLELEEELALARQRLSELQALYNQQVLEKERRHDALESLERRIEEDLGDIEYPAERVQQLRMEFFGRGRQVLAPMSVLPDNLNSEITDLKARMRRLGSINPNAPQEYNEVLQRYEFLQSQIADLDQSATSLRRVIKELDQVMEKEFLSVFSAAAKEFSNYFRILFDGGQARLALADPDNPTTSGVEIFARPPGRRQQSLALLSGGERALTATALLFAVLKAKPLPFCLLDEVDAMLDEANVGRFRALLEEFARQTQFIVITHNRQTIEAGNTIYGVSMGEEGVSEVISLRLKEEETVAS